MFVMSTLDASAPEGPPTAVQPLDNPIWHALTGPQQHLGDGSSLARRFRPDVALFAALAEYSPEAWADLGRLIGAGNDVILNRNGPIEPPDGWEVLGIRPGYQMVLEREPAADDAPGTRPLTADDVPEMVALVRLTEPGPFRAGTIELGGYCGIFVDGRLMAMAGRRIALDDYVEVSAVCTHPDGRRKGYAAAISSTVARGIIADGKTPILHVAHHNTSAKAVYDKLGFVTRALLTFASVRFS
jgi:ribosomal protein S18 acetylase RimI-like enzyme